MRHRAGAAVAPANERHRLLGLQQRRGRDATRLERLEVESRASMGFEFSLRAAAAAADLTDDLLPPPTTPGGRKRVPSNLNPERVLQVLQEYPELADDVNRQVLSSF